MLLLRNGAVVPVLTGAVTGRSRREKPGPLPGFWGAAANPISCQFASRKVVPEGATGRD